MKKHSGFIKNIIMVVASALTLVAVSFAWFTSNFSTNLDNYEAVVSGEALNIEFYQKDENSKYQPLTGDIELENFVPGESNQYKFLITTKTSDKLSFKFSIEGLSEEVPQEFKDYVYIKYVMYTTKVTKKTDGTVTYTDLILVSKSADGEEVPLSDLKNGVIINNLNLSNYQKTASDTFTIYYEIGLSKDAPSTLSGLESELGNIKISAQRVG